MISRRGDLYMKGLLFIAISLFSFVSFGNDIIPCQTNLDCKGTGQPFCHDVPFDPPYPDKICVPIMILSTNGSNAIENAQEIDVGELIGDLTDRVKRVPKARLDDVKEMLAEYRDTTLSRDDLENLSRLLDKLKNMDPIQLEITKRYAKRYLGTELHKNLLRVRDGIFHGTKKEIDWFLFNAEIQIDASLDELDRLGGFGNFAHLAKVRAKLCKLFDEKADHIFNHDREEIINQGYHPDEREIRLKITEKVKKVGYATNVWCGLRNIDIGDVLDLPSPTDFPMPVIKDFDFYRHDALGIGELASVIGLEERPEGEWSEHHIGFVPTLTYDAQFDWSVETRNKVIKKVDKLSDEAVDKIKKATLAYEQVNQAAAEVVATILKAYQEQIQAANDRMADCYDSVDRNPRSTYPERMKDCKEPHQKSVESAMEGMRQTRAQAEAELYARASSHNAEMRQIRDSYGRRMQAAFTEMANLPANIITEAKVARPLPDYDALNLGPQGLNGGRPLNSLDVGAIKKMANWYRDHLVDTVLRVPISSGEKMIKMIQADTDEQRACLGGSILHDLTLLPKDDPRSAGGILHKAIESFIQFGRKGKCL
jgi:hypothetical protein